MDETKKELLGLLFRLIPGYGRFEDVQKRLIEEYREDIIPDLLEVLLKPMSLKNHDIDETFNNELFKDKIDAAETLGMIGGPAFTILKNLFSSGDPGLRSIVIMGIGEVKEESATILLIEALQEDHPEIRIIAATILGKRRGASIIPALVEALKDDNAEVQWNALMSLEKISKDIASVGELQEFETWLHEGYNNLKMGYKGKEKSRIIMRITKLRMMIAKRKNELSQDKGILLDDRPKPPKGKMYQQIRGQRVVGRILNS